MDDSYMLSIDGVYQQLHWYGGCVAVEPRVTSEVKWLLRIESQFSVLTTIHS